MLTELLIALAILALSMGPLTSYPIRLYQKTVDSLFAIEEAMTADLIFRDWLLDGVNDVYLIQGKEHNPIISEEWDRSLVTVTIQLEHTFVYKYFIDKKSQKAKGKVYESGTDPSGLPPRDFSRPHL